MPPTEIASEIDERSKEFLSLLEKRDAPVSTSEIREETGLTNHQVRHRRKKLESLDLIDVDDGETETNRTPPKVHSLTDTGVRMIDNGLLGEVELPRPGTLNEVANRLEHLENTVSEQEDRLRETRKGVQRLRDAVEKRTGGMTNIDGRVRRISSELESLENTLEEHDERIENKRDKRGIL